MTAFEFSVIVAEAEGQTDLRPVLSSVASACAGLLTEVIVVRPRGRDVLKSAPGISLREIDAGDQSLVPQRWGLGVRSASAPVFACLTSEFTVEAGWARTLVDALADGAVGAAGAIALAADAGSTAAAIYLVRFSPYRPRARAASEPASNIPGDTGAYRRQAVAQYPDLLATGFWEIEFHRRFAAEGRELLLLPETLATFHPSRGLFATTVLRYIHGQEYGRTRVVMHRHNTWKLVLGSPVIPFVLVGRIIRRVLTPPRRLGLALRSLPALLLISSAWAAGEASGAWSARRRR